MTELCIVRHGNTDWNKQGRIQGRTDIPLNERGKQQAVHCAKYLQNRHWDVLLSSPLTRAKQTAETIKEKIGFESIKIMDEFTERDYGEASSLLFTDLPDAHKDEEIKGMETKQQMIIRVQTGLQKISQIYRGKKILLVSHGVTINTLLHIASNFTYEITNKQLHNACINILVHENNEWSVKDYNITDHLSSHLLTN